MKVRANSSYIYHPCLLDVCDGRTDLVKGDLVVVKNLPGCPKCNIMNHAHVYKDDKFAGLVCCASLYSPKEYPKLLAEWEARNAQNA
jgi:hypothetical protein